MGSIDDTGVLGETGETGSVARPVTNDVGFCEVEIDRLDFEELGRVIGKAEYEARLFPSRFLDFTITVPVELAEERDPSESFVTG